MKKVILGIVIGIILITFLVYLSGGKIGEVLVKIGKGIEVAGEKLKGYEGVLKDTGEKVKEGIEKGKEKLQD